MQTPKNTRDQILFFVLILCLCGNEAEPSFPLCHSSHNSSYCYMNTSATVTMRQAHNECASFGLSVQLPTYVNSRDYEHQLKAMEDFGLETTWISLTQHQMMNWTSVSGEIEAEPEQGIQLGLCGYYDVNERKMVKGMCHTQESAMFLCQFQGSICPSQVARVNCFIVRDGVLTLHSGSYSWHNSRSICKAFGGDLASSENLTSLNYVLNMSLMRKNPLKNELIGIGLRKMDWHFIEENDQRLEANPTFFGRQELIGVHDSLLACVVLDVNSKTWIRVLCNSTSTFICKMKGKETGHNTDEQEFKQTDIIGIYHTVIVLLAISFSIVTSALCVSLSRGVFKTHPEMTLGLTQEESNNAGSSTYVPEMRQTESLNATDLQSYRQNRRSARQSYNPFDCPPLPPREIRKSLKKFDPSVSTNLTRNMNSSNNAPNTGFGVELAGQIKAGDCNDFDSVSLSRDQLPAEVTRYCLEKQNGRSKLQNCNQLDLPPLPASKIQINVPKVEISSMTKVKKKYIMEDSDDIEWVADRIDKRPDLTEVERCLDTHENGLCQSFASISSESMTTIMVKNPIYQGYSL